MISIVGDPNGKPRTRCGHHRRHRQAGQRPTLPSCSASRLSNATLGAAGLTADDHSRSRRGCCRRGCRSGQAGDQHWLARNASASFVILDAAPLVGQSWTERWDSLTLFTPRRFSALPGLRFPAGESRYPTKAEMADYLQDYEARFDLPVRLGQRVETVDCGNGGFETRTADGLIRSRHLLVATGPFHRPFVPAIAGRLDRASDNFTHRATRSQPP